MHHLGSRLKRLEKDLATLPDGRRRCPLCRDGAARRLVVTIDGEPAPWTTWPDRETTCPACGRDIVQEIRISGIDPAAL